MTDPAIEALNELVDVEERLRVRRERFAALLSHYEDAAGPDGSVPGADVDGAWVLVEQIDDKGHYFLNRAFSRADAEEMAARGVSSGSAPRAIHNLDELAGDEPAFAEGDTVTYDEDSDPAANPDAVYEVIGVESDHENGEMFLWLYLAEAGKYDAPDTLHDYDHKVDEYRVTLVERSEPDERLAVRYDIAGTKVIVVFNTVASD